MPADNDYAMLRKRVGWTNPEIARRLKLNTTTPARWEAGKQRGGRNAPSMVLEWLRDLANAVEGVGAVPKGWPPGKSDSDA